MKDIASLSTAVQPHVDYLIVIVLVKIVKFIICVKNKGMGERKVAM